MRSSSTRDTRFGAAGRRSDASAAPREPAARREKRFPIGGSRSYISPAERDRVLLDVDGWPRASARFLKDSSPEDTEAIWKPRGKHLFRRITVEDEVEREDESAKQHQLWEAMLRFPNAALYHGLPQKPFNFKKQWPNLHTMRVIGRGEEPGGRVKHVYLLHNGLNETIDLLFHYRLAAWILAGQPDAVCVLRPFPGHLTRYPFDGLYATKPLDDYLCDPADLFRQFLRHMLETQWLLSTLVPRSQYLVAAGTSLLAEAAPRGGFDKRATGRSDNGILAKHMAAAWERAYKSNLSEADEQGNRANGLEQTAPDEATESEGEGKYRGFSKEEVTQPTIEEIVDDLRELLGWKAELATGRPRTVSAEGGPAEPEPPCVHVVGYSIGGFMAQAVFCAWPFAVSSCTSLFAGGALRDLAPTTFAHPEEWQAVLHAMRYELDRAFREERMSPSGDGLIAGMEEPLFGYFTRIFYEVFLQYYRGGYSSRVAEFSRRLLFVVGGNDPIVRTKNVLEAGPPKGSTLLQIADVSHFPGGSPNGTKVESEQRRHWLPEVGRVIAKFAERSEGLLNRTLADSWGVYLGRGRLDPDDLTGAAQAEQPDENGPGMLDSAAFSSAMYALVDVIEPAAGTSPGRGWLLIARNEVPPAFLEKEAILAFAQAVHHSESEITHCIKVLRARSERLEKIRDRVSLMVPSNSNLWFSERKRRERFYSKSETASAARIPVNEKTERMWTYFEKEWIAQGVARQVALEEYEPSELARIGPAEADRLEVAKLALTILPDVWIALSETVCDSIFGADGSRCDNEQDVIGWAVMLSKEWRHERKGDHRPAKKRKAGASDEETPLKELEGWIDNGDVVAIEISGAELNPRYRGRRLLDAKDVRKTIIHWALAYQTPDRKNDPPVVAP